MLIATAFLNRFLGFIYRVLTIRFLGAESVGLYETVFPTYLLFLVIATSGVPVALANLVAAARAQGNFSQIKRLFCLSFGFLLGSGIFFNFLLFEAAPLLATHFFPDPRAYGCFLMLTPALTLVALSSAFRGYFQGFQQMAPSALGQVFEQVARVCCGLFLAHKFLPWGVSFAAVGLAAGTVLGEAVGLVYLVCNYFYQRLSLPQGKEESPSPSFFFLSRALAKFSFPVTLNRAAATFVLSLEAVLIPSCLQKAGYSPSEATRLYGEFTGAALPLLHLPTIFSLSLATALVPAISEALAWKNLRLLLHRSRTALYFTFLTGLPCAVIFYLFGVPLTVLLFGTSGAGEALQTLAWGAVFLYLQQATSGILQGLGKVNLNLWNSLWGAAVTLGGIYILVALPRYGIQGAALAFSGGAITGALLNLFALARGYGLYFHPWREIINPLFAAVLMGAISKFIFSWAEGLALPLFFTLGLALGSGLLIYFLFLLAGGSLHRRDLVRLLGGRRFF